MIMAQSGGRFLGTATFDEVVFGEGDERQRLDFEAFLGLSLSDRVRLLLSRQARFYRAGREISQSEAMRYR